VSQLPPPAPVVDRGADAPVQNEWLDLRQLLWVLYRRKLQVLGVICLVVLPVAIWTTVAERIYRSSTMIQIDPEPVDVLPYREIDRPNLTPNYEMFMKSQEQILRSSKLFERVVDRLNADPDPATKAELPKLGERFFIQRVENTQIFRLSYGSPEPAAAAKVANVFAEEYIKLHFSSRQETRERARELLKRELDALEKRVQASETELVNYAKNNNLNVLKGDGGDTLAQQTLAILNTQVTQAQSEVSIAQARVDSLASVVPTDLPEKLITPVISGLQSRSLQLEHELTALRSSFGENWPDVVQKRGEAALVRDQLAREQTRAVAEARDQAAMELKMTRNKLASLSASMSGQEGLVHEVQTVSIQYNILRREVDTNQKMYEGLLERLKQTSVTSGMELEGFRIIEPATPSSRPDTPRVMWNLSLAGVLGLALGICLVFVRHYWDTSVSTIEEIEHVTVLPVLGTVQEVSGSSGGLLSWTQPKLVGGIGGARFNAADALTQDDNGPTGLATTSMFKESVRNICASILMSRSGRPPRVLMVTSAVPGEGKTTLAAELGATFAQTGAKTLLVECDLRRPTFEKMFEVDGGSGLSIFLSGIVEKPAVYSGGRDNLFVVHAGPTPPNPAALLGSDKMSAFLREMLASYEFIILDTPPIVPLADARVLSRMVEGVILVVRAGKVPKHLLQRVCAMLERAGANVLGAILNGTDRNGFDAAYHGYYSSY
jgi:capsular exopolysaccharide synthesis family protein